ncbi:MAG: exodeoxyribonuclease V subunit gamma [Treponema sp.]|nr:exodeoxyribonuclease V subunit gamma [Treponema sp.]
MSKKIYYSMNLEQLADKMINQIIENWKLDPFSSPKVIFADSKVEEWFKFYWINKSSQKNNRSVLMNLNCSRLDNFLKEVLFSNRPEDSEKVRILKEEEVRDIIIQKLSTKTSDGKYYFEKLESDQVKAYLTKENSQDKDKEKNKEIQIDSIRLYDFASIMANLFINYELTRDDLFADCPEEAQQEAKWQQQLYHHIFDDGIKIDEYSYKTLPQLFKENGEKLNINKSTVPLYIFAFSGMGQFYRKVIKEYAKQNPLEIYLQTNAKEAQNNKLLKKWSLSGYENWKLWDDSDSESLAQNYQDSSLLNRLQNDLLNDKTSSPQNSADESITFTGAVTKLREVENLHSQICNLIKDGKIENTSDALVVAPNIQDYKVSIMQVFDQTNKRDKEFPHINYTIADSSSSNSLVSQALKTLFDIAEKGYLCRADLFALLRNYLVQTVRNISEAEVSAFTSWVDGMNIYRNRPKIDDNGNSDKEINDWESAKRRLLLACLTDSNFKIDDESYKPFSDIESGDGNLIYKFIGLIDELEAWLEFSKKTELQASDFEESDEEGKASIPGILRKWLELDGDIPEDLKGEDLVFSNIYQEIENLRKLFSINKTIITKCAFLALEDAAGNVEYRSGSIFTNGISFASLKPNRILPAKYVFMLGMGSKIFPGQDKKNVLDLRFKSPRQEGDDSISAKNKDAFLCQIMSAKEALYISYVNKDLQKDEDFYRASTINDLMLYLFKDQKLFSTIEKQIKIDEDRDWSQLYTNREFRNKWAYIEQRCEQKSKKAISKKDDQKDIRDDEKLTYLDRVSISKLKNFLKEPFQFMAEKRFSTEDSDADEKASTIEKEEFEPIDLSNLTRAEILKTFISENWDNPQPNEEEIKASLRLNNLLPDGIYGDKVIAYVKDFGTKIIEKMRSDVFNNSIEENYIFNESILLEGLKRPDDKSWSLSGQLAFHNEKKDKSLPDCLKTCAVSFSSEAEYRYLGGYISALALIAARGLDNKKYGVELHQVFINRGSADAQKACFTCNKTKAIETLEAIYKACYEDNEKNPKCMPLKELGTDEDSIPSLYKFFTGLTGMYGDWSYFSKAKLFNSSTEIGYSLDNFNKEFIAQQDKIKALILYM